MYDLQLRQSYETQDEHQPLKHSLQSLSQQIECAMPDILSLCQYRLTKIVKCIFQLQKLQLILWSNLFKKILLNNVVL